MVYKTQDTKLGRLAALKFFPAHISVNEETKARFLQEAKAAEALNQSNICTIYSVEESTGTMFMAMKDVDGTALDKQLPYATIDEAQTQRLGWQLGGYC